MAPEYCIRALICLRWSARIFLDTTVGASIVSSPVGALQDLEPVPEEREIRGARCRRIAAARAACGGADLVGRVRGPGLGPAARARARAGRDGGPGDHGDRARSAGLAGAPPRAGARPSPTPPTRAS